jgi:hypothetical protein
MALKDFLNRLSKDKKHTIAIMFIELALPIWDHHADKSELSYRDTVVGLTHVIDRKLLANCLGAAKDYLNSNLAENFLKKKKEKLLFLYDELREPVVALQDGDWDLPYEVEITFYSVYNLIRSLKGEENTVFDEPTIYVSINQAVDALTTSRVLTFDEINEMLANTL